MPKIPFPYPFSVGVDICHIPRIHQLITKDGGKWRDMFKRRILTQYESTYFDWRCLRVRSHKTFESEEQMDLDPFRSHPQDDYRDAAYLAGR